MSVRDFSEFMACLSRSDIGFTKGRAVPACCEAQKQGPSSGTLFLRLTTQITLDSVTAGSTALQRALDSVVTGSTALQVVLDFVRADI